LDKQVVYDIMTDAVTIGKKFMTDALPVDLIGMDSDKMGQYIEYVADRLLVMINYPKLYKQDNPFPFMEKIGLDGKSNFFEGRADEYQDANILKKKDAVITDSSFIDDDY